MDASWITLVLYVGAGLVAGIYFVQVLMPSLRQWLGNRSALDDRAAGGSREAFDRVLEKVPDVPPTDKDAL